MLFLIVFNGYEYCWAHYHPFLTKYHKSPFLIGDLIMLKKLNFHLSYRVFLKDKNIAYFDLKKRAKQRNFGQLDL